MQNSSFSLDQRSNSNNNNNNIPSITLGQQRDIESLLRSNNKLLKTIEEVTEQFIQSYNKDKCTENVLNAVVVCLSLSYTDLLSRSLQLLHLVIEEPLQFESSIKYGVFGIVRNIIKDRGGDLPLKTIDIEQVHILLRFLDLPFQQNLCFQPHLNIYPKGLALVVGILLGYTEAEKEV